MSQVRCAACGQELREGASFCTRCGSPIPVASPPPESTPTVQSPRMQATTIDPYQAPAPIAPAPSSGNKLLWPVAIACGTALALGAMALAFFTHQSSETSPNASVPSNLAPATVTATATRTSVATATSTVVAVVTETATATAIVNQPVPAGGQYRPSDWPTYRYDGPASFDVCQTPYFPLSTPIMNFSAPSIDSQEEYTLVSAQSALRALNYGSPNLVVPNGIFDADMQRTISGYQQRHKIPVTGTLDEATWANLNSAVHYWIGTCA